MKLTIGLAAAASLGMAGCVGVPVAVSAASLYVDTVLYLRTSKTATDHIISAAADRDCSMVNVLLRGRLCEDGPPPQLLTEMLREVETVPPSSDSVARAARDRAEGRVEVAEADPLVLTDSTPAPGAAPLPAPARTPPPAPPPAPADRPGAVETALRDGGKPVLVVVGSFTKRAHAEAQRAAIPHPSMDIVEATVFGKLHYRVVIRPTDREDALRQLAIVRTAGIKDAWLLPWSGNLSVTNAVAALPYVGWLYRI
ncbi:SPOR domain-containing protein [Azospirillum sp. sgz301742]